jgi:hypothetical protein
MDTSKLKSDKCSSQLRDYYCTIRSHIHVIMFFYCQILTFQEYEPRLEALALPLQKP